MDSIPILKIGYALLVTIQVDMHDRLATQLQEDLTSKIVQHHVRGVLIDISALEIVDSFIGRMLANIASVSRLLDADTVVVGMRPEVAITQGRAAPRCTLDLEGVHQSARADDADAHPQHRAGRRPCSPARAPRRPPPRLRSPGPDLDRHCGFRNRAKHSDLWRRR